MFRSITSAALSVLLVLTALVPLGASGRTSAGEALREAIRARIEDRSREEPLHIGEEVIHASIALPLFYERRAFQSAWYGPDGFADRLDEAIRCLEGASREGLNPDHYHLPGIRFLRTMLARHATAGEEKTLRAMVDLELLTTDALLVYGSHLLSGWINPTSIDPEWLANRRGADLANVLQEALDRDRISETMNDLLPPQDGYRRTRAALGRYRAIAALGGWDTIAPGGKLQNGDEDERVEAIRRRLIITADLAAGVPVSALFDETLEVAVTAFQKRHGLETDGVVGSATLAAMNVPIEARIEQLILNMERWRWLPQDLGERYVLVNIADFRLDVIESGTCVLDMPVIVGRSYRRTPVFSDRITSIVLNPRWEVPPSLAKQDILPLVQKDPEYLREKNITLLKGWGSDMTVIDPATVDWSRVTPATLPYRFRQEPGPQNALGRIKFMFPNAFNVYLHDTPARELFDKAARGFSSGCIRVAKPLELAEYLLRDDPAWPAGSLLAAIDSGREQTLKLLAPVPVHLLYWTAWVSGDGIVQFRSDIYQRDGRLAAAFMEDPAGKPYGGR